MTVLSILQQKGRDVTTLPEKATIADALALLSEKNIGALVIVAENGAIAGILSERDIVRALARDGAAILKSEVHVYMTAKVISCEETTTINQVLEKMTKGRFRHLPVVNEGQLTGLISIGDVVKARIAEAEQEAQDMRHYITN
jgi:CBS domain-containing protein